LPQKLPNISSEKDRKWVLIYGATSDLGRKVSKVFAEHQYGLILVDSNLNQLQELKQEL